jgi:thymidine phosphorylase
MSLLDIPSEARERRPTLRAKRLHLNTQSEPVVVMRTRIAMSAGPKACPPARKFCCPITAIRCRRRCIRSKAATCSRLDEAGLSESAWDILNVEDGEAVEVSHAPMLESLASVRRRIYGARLDGPAFDAIVHDVVAGRYTEVHLASFLTASAAFPARRGGDL